MCITSAESTTNTFTEKNISLHGYHLCNYSVIKNVSKTVPYQKSYEKQTPCGGWIPWRMCTTTYYKEEYHPIMVQEAVNVTDCCAGYEQVGLYCSLPINRSSEFASRPGACPMKIGEAVKSSCVSDMDCPKYKKCCKTSTGTHCSDPVPEEQTVTRYWYNVSVLVKRDFSELYKVAPRLLNHSRLLHSMITGALWPMNISVYHIQTTKSETNAETIVSHVLVGLQQLVPLVNISSLLKKIVIRVYDVIDVVVQDCDRNIPNILIKKMHSSNLLRNSRSVSPEIHVSVDSECDSPSIRNHKIFSVTSSSFEASWSINSLQNHSFRAEVYKDNELVERMETTDTKLTMLNLEAGIMYTMNISYEACGKNITSSRIVKTDALIFGLTLRILNYNFTDQFLNVSSREYQNFSRTLMAEIKNSYPSNMNALHLSRKLKVQVDSIKAGSIIVKLKIIIQDLKFPKDLSAFDSMIVSLHNSSMLGIDPKSSAVEGFHLIGIAVEGNAACEMTFSSCLLRKLKVQVDSIKAGSIIVKLKIIIQDLKFPKDLSAFDSMIASLHNSSMLGIDPKSSAVEDWDECACRAENDCSMSAECINTVGSYICRCKTDTDANPARPGRNCEGEIVDPVTTQGSNVTDYTTTAPSSMAEIQEVSSFTKYTEAMVLPSSGIQESSTLPAEETLAASQKMNILENFSKDSTLNSPETVTLAPKWSGNVTISNGTVAEERWTTQGQQNSSMTSSLGVSNIETYSFKRNEPTVEVSTPGFSTERSSENVVAVNVTKNPKFHALNHTLDRHIGGNNSSWSNERNSTASPSSFKENMTISLATDLSAPFPAERIFFSNVTNTSFQISWITYFPANTTFHFLLFEEEQLIKKVKTQSSHLNISKLKAGTLYTVKIKPGFYGNESKTIQCKVKTAAQKFNGAVRIVNLNYSSEFSNSGSEKYQQFSKMFLNEVRTSLPPNILQKMDAGMINISIVSIIPGSIVVNFSLLIPIDMDARNVSGSLLEAFRNSSFFEVDNSSLSINDNNECEREETDCSPNASCYNIYGSYECKCKEGFVSVNAERPGRNCEGKVSILIFIFFQLCYSYCHGIFSSNLWSPCKGLHTLSEALVHGVGKVQSPEPVPAKGHSNTSNGKASQRIDLKVVFTVILCGGKMSCIMQFSITFPYFIVLSSSLSSGDERSKEWSSTALPLTYPYTSDPMPSSAKDNVSIRSGRSLENATANTTINKKNINQTTNIYDLPQNSPLINSSAAGSIKEAVQILCEFEKIVLSIKKDFLHQQSIPETSLYLGNPRCNVTSSNSSHVVLQTDWNECETEIQTNTTHTIARTVLRNDYSFHGVIHHLKISSKIHCIFQNDLLTSSGYTSEGVYTILEDLHGSGHFLTEMRLLIGNSPIPQNFSISGSDNVMIEVGVQTRSKKLRVVVGQCWATPTNNSMDPRSFHFIHGGCPVPNTNTKMIANGIANRARFKLKIFSFVNGSVVYIHCKVKICVELPKSTCRTNCEGFRFWKSGEIIATPKTTWGPLRKFSGKPLAELKTGMGVGYIVLIVIGVLVLALGIAGLLVCRYKRKAGTYDIKRRTEFFNYRAFHD
ncbi:uromodulin-like 1 [Ahaetulla prasina]|uniref:uromodulin-like 1 n=1 Tax=Ahaetulla prasina TaxID=499056 RepID=UPI002648DCBC|nr:uromodulin-like 1 [Ahaetulla prasina]